MSIPISEIISVIDKLLDQIPNYDQRQKNKFKKLKRLYFEELSLERRDHQKIDEYYDAIKLFIKNI